MACHTYTHEISEHRHNFWRYHINKHDIGHTRLEQRQKNKTKATFASPPRYAVKKKKK